MELNLNDIVWPICLLKCNAALNKLNIGEELTLVVKDTDSINHLTKIIKSYQSLTYEIAELGDSFHIKVIRYDPSAGSRGLDEKVKPHPS